MNARINELIYALEKLNPEKLRSIRLNYPGFKKLLESGTILGTDKIVLSDAPQKTEGAERVKTEVCIESGKALIEKCDTELPGIRNSIIDQKKLSRICQLLSAACCFVIVILLTTAYAKFKPVAVVFGIAGVLISLIPVIKEYFLTRTGKRKIDQSYEQIVKERHELEQLNRELILSVHTDENGKDVSAIINNCNTKTFELMQLLQLS
jgi:hypothetical protein